MAEPRLAVICSSCNAEVRYYRTRDTTCTCGNTTVTKAGEVYEEDSVHGFGLVVNPAWIEAGANSEESSNDLVRGQATDAVGDDNRTDGADMVGGETSRNTE